MHSKTENIESESPAGERAPTVREMQILEVGGAAGDAKICISCTGGALSYTTTVYLQNEVRETTEFL